MATIIDLFNGQISDAKFSEDGKHRLWLNRIWDTDKPLLLFIGLNPSTANAKTDDPTIRRIKSICQSMGYGGFYMMNLFTFISTDPKKLNIKQGNVVDADFCLKCIEILCEKVVFVWGNFNVFGRDAEIKEMFPKAYALHINKNGSPKHPLYCRSNITLKKYKWTKIKVEKVKPTIKEFLLKLPEPYKTQAMENGTLNLNKHFVGKTIKDALMSAFVWNDSSQGGDYWNDLCINYLL